MKTENENPNLRTTNGTFAGFLKISDASEWEAHLLPLGHARYRPIMGAEPNWFHRQMHRIFFGIVWKHKPLKGPTA